MFYTALIIYLCLDLLKGIANESIYDIIGSIALMVATMFHVCKESTK